LEGFPADGWTVRWQARVGWGYSSPVVAKGRVYLTDCQGPLPKAKERLLCFDERTGTLLWDYSTDVTYAKDTYFVDKEGKPTIPGQLPTPADGRWLLFRPLEDAVINAHEYARIGLGIFAFVNDANLTVAESLFLVQEKAHAFPVAFGA